MTKSKLPTFLVVLFFFSSLHHSLLGLPRRSPGLSGASRRRSTVGRGEKGTLVTNQTTMSLSPGRSGKRKGSSLNHPSTITTERVEHLDEPLPQTRTGEDDNERKCGIFTCLWLVSCFGPPHLESGFLGVVSNLSSYPLAR